MNKEDIFNKLNNLPFKKEDYLVIAGASLVVQDLKEKTQDIDLAISQKLFNKIKKELVFSKTYFGSDVYLYNDIEVSTNYFDLENSIKINDINFANLESILKLKQHLNRKKDQKDIKAIDLALCLKDNLRYEKQLYQKGIELIAGVDEVGRGPLVGPVVAAAVILPKNYHLEGLTDSKKVSEKNRNIFYEKIKKDAISFGIGVIPNTKIDEVNIYEATKLAMKQALDNLDKKPKHVLIDAMKLDLDIPSTPIIKGDLKSISISAASIIAKVYRDNLLIELDKKYPHYNFKKNKGYPTKEHIKAINEFGIIDEHRKSYNPVKEYINKFDNN